MEVKEATSRNFQGRAGGCLPIPSSFILFDFAWKAGGEGKEERKTGPWIQRKECRGGGEGRRGGGSGDSGGMEVTQRKGRVARECLKQEVATREGRGQARPQCDV